MFKHFTKAACAAAILAASAAQAQPTNPTTAPPPSDQAPAASPAPPSSPAAAEPPAPPKKPPEVVFTTSAERPFFMLMSPGHAAFAAIGAVAAIASSKTVANENELTDPANEIQAEIAKSYAGSQGLTLADAPIVIQPGNPKAATAAVFDAAKAQGAHYIVDVATQAWEFIYFSFDWTHYGVIYGARLQVIDVDTKKPVVSGRCLLKPEKTPDSPNKDQLLADKAARLKAMSAEAAHKCAAILKSDVLKLPATTAAAAS